MIVLIPYEIGEFPKAERKCWSSHTPLSYTAKSLHYRDYFNFPHFYLLISRKAAEIVRALCFTYTKFRERMQGEAPPGRQMAVEGTINLLFQDRIREFLG